VANLSTTHTPMTTVGSDSRHRVAERFGQPQPRRLAVLALKVHQQLGEPLGVESGAWSLPISSGAGSHRPGLYDVRLPLLVAC
jgi:hypothetical protein